MDFSQYMMILQNLHLLIELLVIQDLVTEELAVSQELSVLDLDIGINFLRYLEKPLLIAQDLRNKENALFPLI